MYTSVVCFDIFLIHDVISPHLDVFLLRASLIPVLVLFSVYYLFCRSSPRSFADLCFTLSEGVLHCTYYKLSLHSCIRWRFFMYGKHGRFAAFCSLPTFCYLWNYFCKIKATYIVVCRIRCHQQDCVIQKQVTASSGRNSGGNHTAQCIQTIIG